MSIRDNRTLLNTVLGSKLNNYLQPKTNQGGLLNFVRSPYAGDIGMGLLSQSGFSTMPQSFGQSLGLAVNQANQLRDQRNTNQLAELSTLANLSNTLQQPERRIVKGVDGFNYFADTRERVLPNAVKTLDTDFKEYFSIADGSSKILDEKSPTFLQDVEGYTSVEPQYKPLSDNYIKTENGLFDLRTQQIVKGTEPVVDRLEKDEYIKTDNGLYHIPTGKIVDGTEKVPDNFRLLTEQEKLDKNLDVDKPYQINTKNDKISGLANGQTINLVETFDQKKKLKIYDNQLSIVNKDQELVKNWSKERGAIERIELGLENFRSGEFADSRSFIGGVIKLIKPDADLSDFFGEGGAITKSGTNEFKRILFDGLQNLNQQEVQTISDILPSIGITPYANDVIIGALKINNAGNELLDKEARKFQSDEIDYKTYTKNVEKIKKDVNKKYTEFYESSKTVNNALQKEIKANIGTPIQAFDVNGNTKSMTVESSDKWSGQYDINGMPIIKKITGEFYAVELE